MARWTFRSRSGRLLATLESGGRVHGDSELSWTLRRQLQAARAGEAVAVVVSVMPGGYAYLPVVVSDFWLNAIAGSIFVSDGQEVSFQTDYREGADVPDEVRKLRRRLERNTVPGRIY